MQNKPRKAMVGAWFVLFENEEFIYWGEPRFKRLFSDKRIVDDFYKTSKKDLQQQFPNYKKIEGNDVRLRLQELILAEEKKSPAKREVESVSVSLGFKATLLENAIEIVTPCDIKIKEKPDESIRANYKVLMDKNTLDLIEIHRIF